MYLDLDNVPFYVGKGKDDRHKVYKHSTKQPFLENKIRKVGVNNIKIHFLHENLTEKEAFSWESYWIKYIGRRDLGQGSLVNLTDGGEGSSGWVCPEETRKKIGEANKGRKPTKTARQKMSRAHMGNQRRKGIPHSKETKRKMSKAHKGNWTGEKNPMYGKPAWNKGKKMSEEQKEKLRGQKRSEETEQKISQMAKARPPISKETRQKMGEAQKGRKHSKETKRKISENNIKRWKNIKAENK